VPKVMIFIDGSNFWGACQEHIGEGTNIDLAKFVTILAAGRDLVRTYYYAAAVGRQHGVEKAKKQQAFFAALERIPYFEVRLGRFQKRPGMSDVEKGVDTKIAVDMVQYAHKGAYDVAILVTADGDFEYVIDAVKDTGKHVEVAFLKDAKLQALKKAADAFIPLDKNSLRDCIM
jgi:uncharacterized LabA/DUF88 family protein